MSLLFLLAFVVLVVMYSESTIFRALVLSVVFPTLGLAIGGFTWSIAGMFGLASLSLASFFSFVATATIAVAIVYFKL